MVRLEVTAVKALRLMLLISIPVWYDWKHVIRLLSVRIERISIPVWYDWKEHFTFAIPILSRISIPVWYDWKCLPV